MELRLKIARPQKPLSKSSPDLLNDGCVPHPSPGLTYIYFRKNFFLNIVFSGKLFRFGAENWDHKLVTKVVLLEDIKSFGVIIRADITLNGVTGAIFMYLLASVSSFALFPVR